MQAEVSSPDLDFEPDTCQLPFDCDSPEDPPTECSSQWDKSSLSFTTDATVCNTGDGPSLCETPYEIWFAAQGNPKNGSQIASGTVGPLGATGCHDFTTQLQALCQDAQYSSGKLKVKALQHPGHPGTGELWSATYDCSTGQYESDD